MNHELMLVLHWKLKKSMQNVTCLCFHSELFSPAATVFTKNKSCEGEKRKKGYELKIILFS